MNVPIGVGLVACVALAIGGGTAFAADKNGNLTIGFVGKTSANAAFRIARFGAEQAAKAAGGRFGIQVRIKDASPAREDPQAEAEAIEQLLLQGVDGIAVSCSNASVLTPAIDDAVAAGVPVATFGSDAPASKRFFCYVMDNEACGESMMFRLGELMGGRGFVAILGGEPGDDNFSGRIAGARKALVRYPGMTLRSVFYCRETPGGSAARLAAAMKSNPDIGGWILVGSWPLSAPDALPWAPGKVHCVSVGILPNQIHYVSDGHVDLVIAQPYLEWGYRPVERLVLKIMLGRDPAEPVELAPLEVVTSESAADFEKTVMARWPAEK